MTVRELRDKAAEVIVKELASDDPNAERAGIALQVLNLPVPTWEDHYGMQFKSPSPAPSPSNPARTSEGPEALGSASGDHGPGSATGAGTGS